MKQLLMILLAIGVFSACNESTTFQTDLAGDGKDYVTGVDIIADELAEREVVPRWVLRDKNGKPVPVLVEPVIETPKGDRGKLLDPPVFSCFTLKGFRTEPAYALATGKMKDCTSTNTALYSDPDCNGSRYGGPPQEYAKFDDQVFAIWGEPVNTDNFYALQNGECVDIGSASDYYEFRPVPDDILNLFPDAPYSLGLEY